MPEITIADLVRNGTMNAEMAALLWAAVDEQQSFLTVALPRFAGKSTTSNAILALRPEHVPLHEVAGESRRMEQLKQDRLGGYLVVGEFSQAPVPGYIWGEPVRRVFETLPYGYSLQTALHARTVEEAIELVTRGNGISDEAASSFKLVLYIERFGSSHVDFWRRLVEIYEVHSVQGGKPIGHPLFKWRQSDDSFEKVSGPHQFGRDAADLAHRASIIADLVVKDRTSPDDVAAAVHDYRSR